jgi:hypothetical protein
MGVNPSGAAMVAATLTPRACITETRCAGDHAGRQRRIKVWVVDDDARFLSCPGRDRLAERPGGAEAATIIVANSNDSDYTAIMRGARWTIGISAVEIYAFELTRTAAEKL